MSKELNSGEGERMIDKMSEIDLSDWVKSGKPLSEYKADIADREKSNPGGLTDEGMEYLRENQDGGRLEDGRFITQDGKGAFDTEEEAQAYDAEVRQENVEKIRATAEAGGRDLGQDIQQLREVASQLNPAEATGFEDTYIPNLAENNQSWLSDFGESLYEGLILDTLKGVTNLIPTVTQAFSENVSHSVEKGHDWKDDWTTGWIENTTAWFDGISPTYSDAYYKGDGYRKLATGLGQGFGFVGGIMLGGSAIAQGLGKGLGMVNKVAKLNKYGEIVGQVGKPTKWANRIGSFTAGTTMMYPMVYEEAIQKGVNPVHAARLALGIAGVVSTTEGMALEWIGKSMSKPLIKKATKEVLNKELVKLGKTTSLKEVYALEKNFTKGFVEKLKAMGPKVFQGSAIEFGQEFSQTYIEEGMKQMYDGTIGKGKKEGEGNFGADIGTFETFKEAAWGGLIGAIVGGTLPAAGNIRGKVEQESLFGYVNQNVRRKKPNNNFQLEKSIRELEASGRLTPDQANKASDEIKNMVRFSTETKGLNINSGIANYQLFQLSENNKIIKDKFDKTFRESETLPAAVAATYVMNKKMGNEIATAINEDMSTIIEDKQAWTKNKVKFEKRIGLYNKLALKVIRNEITEEDFTKELEGIKTGKTAKPSKQAAKKNGAKVTEYKTKNGDVVTESAMENAESIITGYKAAGEISSEAEIEFQSKIKEEYGIDEKGLKFLFQNEGATVKEMKANLEELEVMAQKTSGKTEVINKELKAKVADIEQRRKADLDSIEFKETFLGDTYVADGYESDGTLEGAKKAINDKYDAELSELEKSDKSKDDTKPSFGVDFKNVERESETNDTEFKKRFDAEQDKKTQKYITQVKEQENLTDKDLNAIMDEADAEGVMSPDLMMAISERRDSLNKTDDSVLTDKTDKTDKVDKVDKGPKDINKITRKEREVRLREKYPDGYKVGNSFFVGRNEDGSLDAYSLATGKKLEGKLAERAKNQHALIPGMIKAKMGEFLDSDKAIPLFELMDKWYDVQIKENANQETVQDQIADKLFGVKFKSNKELEADYLDLPKSWISKDGVSIDTFVTDTLMAEILELENADTQELIEEVKDFISEYKHSREYLKERRSEFDNDRADIADQFEELSGIRLSNEVTKDNDTVANAIMDELVSKHFYKQPVGEVDQSGYQDYELVPIVEGFDVESEQNEDYYEQQEKDSTETGEQGGTTVPSEVSEETDTDVEEQTEEVDENRVYPGDVIEYDGSFYKVEAPENIDKLSGEQILALEEDGYTGGSMAVEAYLNMDKFDLMPWNVSKNKVDDSDLHPTGPLFGAPLEVLQNEGFKKVKKGEFSKAFDSIQDAEIVEETQEQIDDAVNDALNFLDETNDDVKDQRLAPNSPIVKDTIRQNPKLQAKIVKHFQKIFPNIPVSQVEKIASEYGGEVLGRVVEQGIQIDSSRAFQNTIIHEYAHVYIKILGKNNPIIKKGLELMEGSQYFKDAQKKYPDLSKADQLEEALAEAIADNSYDKLKVKLDGNLADKFVAVMKKFWAAVKRNFTKSKGKDIVSIIADGMTFGNQPFTYDSKILKGLNKDQRASKKAVATTSMLQAIVSRLRVGKIQDSTKLFDPTNSVQLSQVVYDVLKNRYIAENKIDWKDSDTKIFENVSVNLIEEKTIADRKINRTAMMEMMQEKMPELYTVTQRTIESFSKNPLPTIDEVNSDSAVKANKKISESLRSIVTSIVDYEGRSIEADNIYRYVADVAQNTYGKKQFRKKIKDNADAGVSIEAIRFYEMMQEMPKGIKDSIESELSSLIQTKYKGITITRNKDTGKLELRIKLVNKDESLASQLNEAYQRVESLSNDFGLREIIETPSYFPKLKDRNSDIFKQAKKTIEDIFDMSISNEDFNTFVDLITEKNPIGLGGFITNVWDVFNGSIQKESKTAKKGKAVTGKHINTYLSKLFNAASDKTALTNTFPNMSGNSVSSTNFGYFISEQISMIFNKPGHLELMKKNPLYKNNPVLKMISDLKDKGVKSLDWSVHDAISNMFTNKTIEHGKQVQSDTLLMGLSYFAATANKDSYDQSIGISGDRSKTTTVQAPRFKNVQAIANQLNKDASTQQKMFNDKIKGIEIGSKDYNTIVDNFNSMYMNKINEEGKVVSPLIVRADNVVDNNPSYPKKFRVANEKNIAILNKTIRNNKLTEAIGKDLVGFGKPYNSLKELVNSYYYTEAINRSALMDIFAGPMLDRKNVADAVKRGSGPNSGGTLIEHEKPVTFVVYDVPSEVEEGEFTSDSMSIDGSYLHDYTIEESGELGNVGVNKKDFIYQVDPTTNKVLMVKMSSIGLQKEGQGTNFDKMGKEYKRMGEAFLKAEQYFAEKYGDEKPHIKFVDSKTMKGNDGNFKKVKLTDLLNDIENDKFSSLESASFEKEITNHRVAFNLNKDLSKIPLSEQVSTLSTQLRNIASTGATKTEIDAFEDSIVELLQESLGATNGDYNNAKSKKQLENNSVFLDELLKGADEQKSNSISRLLYQIKDHNKNNPNNQITVYDDPNLVNLVQQFIATKLTKDGIRTEVAGAYNHMIPNYGNDLKWYDYGKTGTESHPEVALPTSMFVQQKEGETYEEYEARADKYLADAKEKGGLRVVVVRVPASKGMSTFVATVKYFTDPKANTVIVPDGFIKASDADHDGDKTFVYREDLDNNGVVNENSFKNKVFNNLHKRISSEALIKETKDSLKLDDIKAILNEFGLDQTKGYKLSDAVEVANVTEQMAFGNDAVGILAIASKMLAVMSQSKEELKDGKEISFGYEMTKNPETGKVERRMLFGDEATTYKEFSDAQGSDMARLLQAALDMGNDPILMSTGINQESIGVATTLSLLGVDTKEIIGFLTDPDIQKFNQAIFEANTGFSQGDAKTSNEIRTEEILKISPEVGRFKKTSGKGGLTDYIKGPAKGIIKIDEKSPQKEGVYRTTKGDTYYSVTATDVEGDYQVEIVHQLQEGAISKIDNYIDIQKVSNSIQELIPILQLDSKLPNTGMKINNLKETYNTITEEEFPITTDNLLARPLNKHQKSVSDMQRTVTKQKFITENEAFYNIANQFKKIAKAKKAVDNSFMQQHAQNQLRLTHSDPKSFIYDFSKEVNNILYTSIVGEVQLSDAAWSDIDTRKMVLDFIEEKDSNPRVYEEKLLKLSSKSQETIKDLMNKYNNSLNSFDKNYELGKNPFMSAIQMSWTEVESEDQYGESIKTKENFLIKSKGNINKLSPSVLQEIKDGFLKLPQEMQDKFIDYQLLRHGVNEKMGSLMGILPDSLSLKTNTLANISEIDGMNREDYFKNQRPLIQRNVALSMFNKLAEPQYANKIAGRTDNVLSWNGKDVYIKKGNDIYERTNEKVQVENNEPNIYKKITNSQFIAGKDFTKFGDQASLEISEVTDKEIEEEIKKCKIKT